MTSKRDVLPKKGHEGARQNTQASIGKRPYRSPGIEIIGDIRDITLSPSPGAFESGMGGGFFS